MTAELREACKHAMHVIKRDGQVLRAGRGALFVMEQVGFVWTARFLRLIPFIWFVELGYWTLAKNRKFFAKFLFRKDYTSLIVAQGDSQAGAQADDHPAGC
jgi:hypothetical protein